MALAHSFTNCTTTGLSPNMSLNWWKNCVDLTFPAYIE